MNIRLGFHTPSKKTMFYKDWLLIAYSVTFFAFPNVQDEGKHDIDISKLQVHEIAIEAPLAPQRIIHLRGFPHFDTVTQQWKI